MPQLQLARRLAAAFFILSSLVPVSALAADGLPHFWEGTVSVHRISHGPPSLTGVYDTKWSLRVRWKEAQRLEVVDGRGKLVGQLVRLEDQGSSWQGEETGYWVHHHGDVTNESAYSGSGSGYGRTISVGWIYFSLSDQDPLAGVLPSGAYCFGSGSGTTAAFDTQILNVVTTPDRVDSSTIPFNGICMLDYFVGRMFMGFGGVPTDPVPAEMIMSMAPGMVMEGHDDETRVIQDGRMRGSYDNTIDTGNDLGQDKSLQWIVSWNVKRTLGIKAVLEKAPENWRPTLEQGNRELPITARIEDPPGIEGKFEFTLYEVSREKGHAMNAGSGQDPDLEFPPGQAGLDGPQQKGGSWLMEATGTASQATVKVRALDYGAWGRLKARVNVDGEWHDCLTEDGKDSITIPLDDDENRIADFWEREHGVAGQKAIADGDNQPEDVGDPDEPGDGFSNYEEYRGFEVQGQWIDTDPREKDLFIRDQLGFGVGYFTDLGLKLHLIGEGEFSGERTVNFNRDQEKTLPEQKDIGQKGLLLIEGGDDTVYGQASKVGCPNVVDTVEINLQLIWDDYLEAKKYDYPGFYHWHSHQETPAEAQAAPKDFLRELYATIAHELGHAVNILHHADSDPCPGEVPNYSEIPYEESFYIWINDLTAIPGGQWSGDLNCVMIRPYPINYHGSDGEYHLYPEELVPYPSTFCSSKEGTSVNAAGFQPPAGDERPYPVAGNATYGNCRRMVDLKGKHYYGDIHP